jgi:hypothetical protein
MGCIVREKFPRLVTIPNGRTSVAWTWKHYSYPPLVPMPDDDDDFEVENTQQRVLAVFWVSFYDFSSFNNSGADPSCKK